MRGATERTLQPNEVPHACQHLVENGARLQMAYAWFPEPGAPPEILYLADQGPRKSFSLLRCQLAEGSQELQSLAKSIPLLGWYEREMTDLCGIPFQGHPEPRPLVLHEGAHPSVPPLDPRYPKDEMIPYTEQPWDLPPVEGSDVQILPFGPVRADVLESAQIVFYYVGEAILHCHPRLFFKHRGMEKRFEGLSPVLGTLIAERISGVDSVAHALAFCQAIETASQCEVPERARYLRTILAELERLYNHLHYLGHLCHTTTLKVGEAQGKLLAEQCKQLNGFFTGSRFLRGLLKPGGLRRDLNLSALSARLRALEPDITDYMAALENTNSHLDRLITTGHLPHQIAFDQGATGPIKRASGIQHDLRCDHPYAAYDQLSMEIPMRTEGDAHARSQIRMEEIRSSLALLLSALDAMPEGPIETEITLPSGGEGLGWCEGPRGSIYYCVHFDATGKLVRVKVKSASFSNWRVFPFTVHDTNMMDYAINEASFGLTMAGCDR
ncbi:MAG TPA: NADH-quinone oxidoreductase subunit C [Acidobacteriaceae bacterium]|nr:NADH-quinone oxidoreductase subunit C [Acidobacteriaceae bacterium]